VQAKQDLSSHRLDLSVQILTGRGAEQDGVDQDRMWCGLLVLSWSTPRPVLVPVSEPSTWQWLLSPSYDGHRSEITSSAS
jgi:hypothetical protein